MLKFFYFKNGCHEKLAITTSLCFTKTRKIRNIY